MKLEGRDTHFPHFLSNADAAYADLLEVDGNPLRHIELVATPDKPFVVIMKNGRVVKNTPASGPYC